MMRAPKRAQVLRQWNAALRACHRIVNFQLQSTKVVVLTRVNAVATRKVNTMAAGTDPLSGSRQRVFPLPARFCLTLQARAHLRLGQSAVPVTAAGGQYLCGLLLVGM